GMRQQQSLHFQRIDVLAAAVEHVIGAPPEKEEPFRVAAEQVAGAQPSVDDALPVDRGQVVVARSHARVAHPKLTVAQALGSVGADKLDLSLGPGHAAASLRNRAAIGRRADHYWTAFGQAIALSDLRLERSLHRLLQLARRGCGADGERLEGGEVQALQQIAVLQEQGKYRRNAAGMSAAIA